MSAFLPRFCERRQGRVEQGKGWSRGGGGGEAGGAGCGPANMEHSRSEHSELGTRTLPQPPPHRVDEIDELAARGVPGRFGAYGGGGCRTQGCAQRRASACGRLGRTAAAAVSAAAAPEAAQRQWAAVQGRQLRLGPRHGVCSPGGGLKVPTRPPAGAHAAQLLSKRCTAYVKVHRHRPGNQAWLLSGADRCSWSDHLTAAQGGGVGVALKGSGVSTWLLVHIRCKEQSCTLETGRQALPGGCGVTRRCERGDAGRGF